MSFEPFVMELTPPPDPWEVARKLATQSHLIFLDSAGGPKDLTRYSYIAANPTRWVERPCHGDKNPFDRIEQGFQGWKAVSRPDLPPFQGGLVGLFAYDLNRWLERIPKPRIDDFQLPELAFGIYDCVFAWDHRANRCWIVSTGFPELNPTRREHYARTRAMYFDFLLTEETSDKPLPLPSPFVVPQQSQPLAGFPNVFTNFNRRNYLSTVARAIEYVHAGDCFQVNIAQRLMTPLKSPTLELYGRLRDLNPAPFAGYFDLGHAQIASASPERFLKMDSSGSIETRPIKGTRPRGATPERDEEEKAYLRCSPKDRAENVMIVDLLRNDLGRVCEYGSVKVSSLCELETYPTVHHLVSEVRGQLRQGLTAVDLLKAAFPGGSVTGAPKVRAMEIIAELEPHARGAYCGCLGWIGFDGAMDTNILIRTFTAAGGWLQFPVGGGIVADSDPAREYEETLHKAAGLLRALE